MSKFVVFLVMLFTPCVALAQGDSFDVPLEKTVVDLGPSFANPPGGDRIRIELSCYFYPNFAIKQFDEGQKGAEWLAILSTKAGANRECSREHTESERVIDRRKWDGYFLGVKGNLVFFRAADGEDGGMPFVIYDSGTGKKIFEDSFFYAGMWNQKVEDSPFNDLRVNSAPDGRVVLTYLRVAGTHCDLHRDAASCWEPTRKKLKIKDVRAPTCTNYEGIKDWWTSAVAFPIEVSLFPKATAKNIDGPVKCWPVD